LNITAKKSETFRTSNTNASSVEELKLESELIRETVDDLTKAVNSSGNPGGSTTKSLDSLYDIFSQIIVSPYIDQHRLIDLA
jgi:hypothetical protein